MAGPPLASVVVFRHYGMKVRPFPLLRTTAIRIEVLLSLLLLMLYCAQVEVSGAMFPGLPTVDTTTASLVHEDGGTQSFVLQVFLSSPWGPQGSVSTNQTVQGCLHFILLETC